MKSHQWEKPFQLWVDSLKDQGIQTEFRHSFKYTIQYPEANKGIKKWTDLFSISTIFQGDFLFTSGASLAEIYLGDWLVNPPKSPAPET
ncbi:hypothetical protein NPIL_159931 [Nephila pilipes]|uniref:Uncharacterized protein n=1 Tax=Nephila pilipes TaxID=299642 RepID=A0A8X6TLM3_NEPPI|nr:hypothetical protein NPIL_159931 [Nephila pilipes]